MTIAVVRRAVLSLTTRASAEGRRSISYADLGVEQLGAVYEHLLDFVVSTAGPGGGEDDRHRPPQVDRILLHAPRR